MGSAWNIALRKIFDKYIGMYLIPQHFKIAFTSSPFFLAKRGNLHQHVHREGAYS